MFIVSQVYAATDPNLPTSFTLSGLPGGDIVIPAEPAPDGSVALHFDLAKTAPGTYTVTGTASNSAGTSAASSALSVVVPAPVAIPAVPVLSVSAT
jgi:hypothetical protein